MVKTDPTGPLTFICSSLGNYNKVRGGNSDRDTVCLKMWGYLSSEDRVVTGLVGQVTAHQDAMRAKAVEKQSAKALRRRALADAVADDEIAENQNAALRAGDALAVAGPISDGESVVRFVLVNQMNTKAVYDDTLAGMVIRGLCVRTFDDGSQCLGCRHHTSKQFRSLGSAVDHFRSYGYHRCEENEVALQDSENQEDAAALPRQEQELCFFVIIIHSITSVVPSHACMVALRTHSFI